MFPEARFGRKAVIDEINRAMAVAEIDTLGTPATPTDQQGYLRLPVLVPQQFYGGYGQCGYAHVAGVQRSAHQADFTHFLKSP